MSVLAMKAWSPYAAGVVIGLLQIPAFLLIDTALGASSSYVTVGGHVAGLFDSAVADNAYFASHLWGAKNWWQVALIVGIALGALLSARSAGTVRPTMSPVWARAVGIEALGERIVMGFIGGFVLLLGARFADGCTSGHGLSGLAQLAVGSVLAVAAMFAGGIATAMSMRRI